MNRSALLSLLLVSVVTLAQRPPHPTLTQAQTEYRQALSRHDTLSMAEAAYLMGKRYQGFGDYVSARQWLLQSLRIRETRGASIELNRVYVQLAASGVGVENYDEAFAYGYRALANSQKLKHPHSLMSAYGVLSGLHLSRAEQRSPRTNHRVVAFTDSAFWYMQRAEAIALSLNDPKEIAGIRHAKGTMLAENEPQKAIPLFTYALGVYEKHGKNNNCAVLHLVLANAYIMLNQLTAARQHLLNAERMCQEHKPIDADVPTNIQYSWASWHRGAGHWELAYDHLRVADSLRQLALTTEQRAVIVRLNVAYETDRRENLLKTQRADLALRNSRLQVQRYYTYAVSGLLVLAATIGFLFYRLNRQNKRISFQNAQLVQEQSHRMKNNLQTISGLLSLQSNRLADADAKRAVEESQLRVQTMALLNRKLYDMDQLVSLGLPAIIPDVVESVLRSYGYAAISPHYDLEPVPLHVDQAIPIALIINELVTNACKYAFPGDPAPSLRIRCWREEGRMWLRVQDNGPGMPTPMNATGFGLSLIAIQVRQLRGEYGFSKPPGVTFDLSAPIKQ